MTKEQTLVWLNREIEAYQKAISWEYISQFEKSKTAITIIALQNQKRDLVLCNYINLTHPQYFKVL